MNRWVLFTLALFLTGPLDAARAQAPTRRLTTPREHLGFNLGDDYCLANYQQLTAYWAKLEQESDRLKVVKIGTTEEGRPQFMGVVTSPANHKRLGRYQEIARRLGLSLATVKIRLHRARARLYDELRRNCRCYVNERGELMGEPRGTEEETR